MKGSSFINPTEYFFKQAMEAVPENKNEIDNFVSSILNMETCVLCKNEYNFTNHLPRIMIHCGHTFCHDCIKKVYRSLRLRCPLCQKLIKNVLSLDRLPINHSIFHKIAQKFNSENEGEDIDAQAVLYSQFAGGGKLKRRNSDEEKREEYEYLQCIKHGERYRHFICLTDNNLLCRLCAENSHAKEECDVVDLYEIEDVVDFLRKRNLLPVDHSDRDESINSV